MQNHLSYIWLVLQKLLHCKIYWLTYPVDNAIPTEYMQYTFITLQATFYNIYDNLLIVIHLQATSTFMKSDLTHNKSIVELEQKLNTLSITKAMSNIQATKAESEGLEAYSMTLED